MAKLLTIALLLLTSQVFAAEKPLDGKTYCRTFTAGGSGGVPKRDAEQCLTFMNGLAIDGEDPLLGDFPKNVEYSVESEADEKVVVFGASKYKLSVDRTLLIPVSGSQRAGSAFTLQK